VIEMVATQGWPPRWLTEPPTGLGSRGDRACDFISTHCRVTKDSVGGRAGDLIVLRPWQRELIRALFTEDAAGKLVYRHALIGLPRKNGKSSVSAGVGLFALLFSGNGAEIYSCAGDRDQARIVFGIASRMVEMDPELRQLCKVYRDAIEVPQTGSVYRVLSAEAPHQEGLSPSLTIFDELHVQPNDDLWNTMELASGARPEPLMLAITTAGVRTDSRGHDSLCYRMYKHGRDVAQGLAADPSFFFRWWEPLAGVDADHRDPDVWREANPGFGDIVAEVDFPSTLQRVHESDFKMKRTNVFVSARESWLPYGAWDRLADPSAHLVDGDTVVLGFDGSIRSDATAIAAVRMNYGEKPFVSLLAVWERPTGDPEWLVPVAEVLDKFREIRTRYHVKEVAADTSYWQEPLQRLHSEGMKILDLAQSPERLNRATTGFYEAVMTAGLVHDGSEVLARHIGNAVLKYDTYGRGRIVKPQKSSEAKVDAAQAAVFAFDYAVNHRGVGAAWLQFMKDVVAKDDAVPASPDAPAAVAPPRAAEFFDAEGMQRRVVCSQHRYFHKPGGGYVCTKCDEERET
jgi:phage terminase large subunit-like protein